MKLRWCLPALLGAVCLLASGVEAQNLFPGSGIRDEDMANGQPFSQGRGMDHIVRQIEAAEPAPPEREPIALPAWMKPRWPEFQRPKFLTPGHKPAWPQLQRPAWLGGQANPPAWNANRNQQGGFFSDAGKNLNDWRQRTGENFRQGSENFRSATSDAWQRMTSGFQSSGWSGQQQSQQPVQPPVRSADQWNGQRVDRY